MNKQQIFKDLNLIGGHSHACEREVREASTVFNASERAEFHNQVIRKLASAVKTEVKKEPGGLTVIEVAGRQILVNGDPRRRISVWRREILCEAQTGGILVYPLEWYEDLLDEYELGYIREDACSDFDILIPHLERMERKGVVVELTLGDSHKPERFPDPVQCFRRTSHFKNLIYEVWNELDRDANRIEVQNRIDWITAHGGIVSFGAYWDEEGEALSEQMDPSRNKNQIISVHRPWNEWSIRRYLPANKPIIQNEIFKMPVEETEAHLRMFMDAGAWWSGVYALRTNKLFRDITIEDPSPWRSYFEMAQRLQKEYN